MANGKRWTPAEDKLLGELHATGMPWREIGERIPDRNMSACWGRWFWLYPNAHRVKRVRASMAEDPPKSTSILDDRDRRSAERDLQDTTAFLMGDPPPSQSATAQPRGASRPTPSPTPTGGEAPTY